MRSLFAFGAFAASAATSFTPHTLAPPSTNGSLCTRATPDGSVVTWGAGDPNRTYVAALDGSGMPLRVARLPDAAFCATPAADVTGAAALAAIAGDHENWGLIVSRRGPDGRFGRFVRLAPVGGGNPTIESAAVSGGAVAVGYMDGDGRPGVVLQRSDGSVVGPIALPAGVSGLAPFQGAKVGLDASGRALALWTAREGPSARLLAATLGPDGRLGPTQALIEEGPPRIAFEGSLAVGADGRAAAAWIANGQTVVVTGDTARGLDLATATAAPIHGQAAVQSDGAAIAAAPTRGGVRIASRTAGVPFSPARYVRAPHSEGSIAVLIDRGRTLVVVDFERDGLDGLLAVTGTAGDPSGQPLPLPVASADVPEDDPTLALPGGAPVVLAEMQREEPIGSPRDTKASNELTAFGSRPGRPSRLRGVRVRVAKRQRLGRSRTVRLRVRCPRACALRVVNAGPNRSNVNDELVSTARRLPAGRATLRVPYGLNPSGQRLQGRRRLRLAIGITDTRGELRIMRRVTVRP